MATKLEPGRKPCSHCGDCCRHEVCPLGEIFMRTTKPPCPALARNDATGDYWCGLIACPTTAMYAQTKYAKHWSIVISKFLETHIFNFGAGCEWKEGDKTHGNT